MSVIIHAASSPGEIRVAVTDCSDLVDFAIWRPAFPDGVGDIHRGRVVSRNRGLGGAFILLHDASHGFLPDRDLATNTSEGDLVTVKVVRGAQAGKGSRLAAAPLPADVHAGESIELVRRGPSPLEQLAIRWQDAEIELDDLAIASCLPTSLRPRFRRVPKAFDDALEASVDALGASEVELPQGMRATITPTPALVAIDMDTAGADLGRSQKQTAQFAANAQAMDSLLRQIRLRNLSGAILIDPAGLQIRKREALLPVVRELLAQDPISSKCLGVTGLGLIEVLRTRIRPPLHELLSNPQGKAYAMLRKLGQEVSGRSRCVVACGAGLFQALEADQGAVGAFAQKYGATLVYQCQMNLPAFEWGAVNG